MKKSGQGIRIFKAISLTGRTKSGLRGLVVLILMAVLVSGYQNCAQKGEIALSQKIAEDTDVTGTGTVTPETCNDCGLTDDGKFFIFQSTEDAAQLPPLKLMFIVDNSHSMLQSQLNLANSFKTLFDSSAGQSLAKFDGEIMIFTTAALNSIYLENYGDNIPAKEPISTLLTKTFDELFAMRSPNLTGLIPGDLNAHIVLRKNSPEGGHLRQSFLSPVHGLAKASDGKPILADSIPFKKGGSLDELNREFQARVSLLDPAKYAHSEDLQFATAGESALCAMARMMRDPGPFIKEGEHVSFVVVSDEDDTNPAGFRCVRTVQYDANNQWTNFEYVAGNAADGPASDLKTYVKTRFNEVLGESKPTASFFIRMPNDPVGGTGSTGSEYISFGQSVGAQLNSVLLPSYASALSNLSGLIKSSIKLVYSLPIPSNSVIKNLYRKNSSGGFDLVSASQWSSEGAVITLNPSLNVQSFDEFKAELN